MRNLRRWTLAAGVMLSLAMSLGGQQCNWPNELYNIAGVPCTYSITSVNGDVGCWASGSCRNGKNISVAFYQAWACGNGSVTASGNNNSSDTGAFCNGQYQFYHWGLQVSATAQVFNPGPSYNQYYGWESDNCDPDGYSFSGPFAYDC